MMCLSDACREAGLPVCDRYNLADVARVLGCSPKTVARMTRSGALPSLRLSERRVFVFADDLAVFLADSYRRTAAGEVRK